MTDMLYNKYRPKCFNDVVEQDAIKQILMHELQTGTAKRCLLFTGGAGTGKAQPLYSKILTPTGFIQMKDVQIGTEVITSKSNIGQVVDIFPQGKLPIYEITLDDNSKIRVADNHLNCVVYEGQDIVLSTLELIEQFEHSTIYIECPKIHKIISTVFGDYESRYKLFKQMQEQYNHCDNVIIYDEEIANTFVLLARSIGAKVIINKIHNNEENLSNNTAYYQIQVFESTEERLLRQLISIEYVGEEECQCIMIDHEDHTYISDDFIPTHNTTSARIYAKELESCSANIIEINCADHTGVDDIRQLVIEPSRQKPLTGNYKIFILDECHQATVQAQNALLKLLEEPPAYCVYILCTTDPQKVLSTILSRCFRYDFQLISNEGIVNRLDYILNCEKSQENNCGIKSWDMDSLRYISALSKGHMRDAINLTQKVISYNGNITVQNVEKVLGVTNFDILFTILDCILTKNEAMLLQQLDVLEKSGINLKLFVKNFLQFTLDVNKYIIFKSEANVNNINFMLIPPSYTNILSKYNVSHKPIITSLLKTLLQLNSSLRWETDVRSVIETNLLMEIL